MNKRFQDKVAVVTGAAQGIGRRVAERLLEEGAQVVAVDRSELVHELAGDACLCLTADLERYAECQRVLERTLERFGRLDILVNNVGGTLWAKPYQHYAEDEIEAELRRSLLPTLWCCRAALPAMLGQGSGAIVNVSSVATRGVNRVPYGAAKAAIISMTENLAVYCEPKGIRVSCLIPGPVLTQVMDSCTEWTAGCELRAPGKETTLMLPEEVALRYGYLDAAEVVAFLQVEKPAMTHVVLTGRNAAEGLIEAADLVTEMTLIKHPFRSGIKAQPGVEF